MYIVVVNHNGMDDTIECLGSISQLDYANKVVVLVDNGSTDGSAEAVRAQFPEVKVIEEVMNLGFGGGCNAGIYEAAEAGAAYVFLAQNDSTVDKRALTELVALAELEPKAGMICGKEMSYYDREIVRFAGGDINFRLGYPVLFGLGRYSSDPEVNSVREVTYGSGMGLLRVGALAEVGAFDPSYFNGYEDLELSCNLRKAGWKIMYNPKAAWWHKGGRSLGRGPAADVERLYLSRRNQTAFILRSTGGSEKASSEVHLTLQAIAEAIPLTAKSIKERRNYLPAMILGLADGVRLSWSKGRFLPPRTIPDSRKRRPTGK